MKGAFTESMDLLIEQAKGKWTAHIEVDQIYAHYQESHPEFHHPRGGQAFYVRDTLYLGQWVYRMAPGLITQKGLHIEEKMRGVAQGLVQGVHLRAPWEFQDLRKSGRGYVTHDGVKVYDQAPIVGRLSPEALRLKGQLRYLHHRR